MSKDICKYCRLEAIDMDDPQHGLCTICLAEHTSSWYKMDLDYLSRP